MVRDDPGAARLALVGGVVHLDEPAAVFDAMLTGWERQQRSRGLVDTTVDPRVTFIRRFQAFSESYPWEWSPADVEDFTVSLMSGAQRRSPATIRGYHLTLRMFCDYVTSAHYGWVRECAERFDKVPSQICFDYNTVAHLQDYEDRPERRPFSYDELETLLDFLDDRVDRAARSGRKGGLSALRDAQMVKTNYAFGLRRRELCMLDVVDLRPNPHMPQWGTYGSVHVRFGKPSRGGIPKRRTVLAVPEFDWVIDGLRQWVEEARWLADPKNHPAL
jgi:integrase